MVHINKYYYRLQHFHNLNLNLNKTGCSMGYIIITCTKIAINGTYVLGANSVMIGLFPHL